MSGAWRRPARAAATSGRAAGVRPAGRARAGIRRPVRLRRAAGVRELRRERRRRHGDPVGAAVEPPIAAARASRPLRDGAPAGMRGRARDRVGDADRLAAVAVDAGAGVPGGRRRVRRAPAPARPRRRARARWCSPRAARVDPGHPAFAAGALVLTTDAAPRGSAERSRPRRSSRARRRRSTGRAALAALRDRGHRLILSEGGPHALGSLLAARLVDELFLTVSPLLIGRTAPRPAARARRGRRPARRRAGSTRGSSASAATAPSLPPVRVRPARPARGSRPGIASDCVRTRPWASP